MMGFDWSNIIQSMVAALTTLMVLDNGLDQVHQDSLAQHRKDTCYYKALTKLSIRYQESSTASLSVESNLGA